MLIGFAGRRQSTQHATENFTGGLAGEGRRQQFVDASSPYKRAEKAQGQGVGSFFNSSGKQHITDLKGTVTEPQVRRDAAIQRQLQVNPLARLTMHLFRGMARVAGFVIDDAKASIKVPVYGINAAAQRE